MHIRKIAVGLLIASLALSASASPWTGTYPIGAELGPSGTAGWLSWNNGQNDTDLFGNPVLFGSASFLFSPDNFAAAAANGASDGAVDQVEVDMTALDGQTFETIRVIEWGVYRIEGDASVDIRTDLWLRKSAFDIPSTFETLNITDDTGGQWVEWTIVTEIANFNNATVSPLRFKNSLQVSTEAGGSAEVVKHGVRVDFPEPGSLIGLLAGAALLFRRR